MQESRQSEPLVPSQPHEPSSPWHWPTRGRLVRAGVRGLLVAVGFACISGPFELTLPDCVFLGIVCGALALLEPWVARAKNRDAVRNRRAVALVLAAIGFVLARAQAHYVWHVWRGGSMAAGLDSLATFGRGQGFASEAALLGFQAEAFALAAVTVLDMRVNEQRARAAAPNVSAPRLGCFRSAWFLFGWDLAFASANSFASAFAPLVAHGSRSGRTDLFVFVPVFLISAVGLALLGAFGAFALTLVAEGIDRVLGREWDAPR